jgi:hypothetical protein
MLSCDFAILPNSHHNRVEMNFMFDTVADSVCHLLALNMYALYTKNAIVRIDSPYTLVEQLLQPLPRNNLKYCWK